MLVKSGCVQIFYSLTWEINHRTTLKSSDSDTDILKGFQNVLTVVFWLLFDISDFRIIYDQ